MCRWKRSSTSLLLKFSIPSSPLTPSHSASLSCLPLPPFSVSPYHRKYRLFRRVFTTTLFPILFLSLLSVFFFKKRVLEHQQDCNGSSSSSATTNGCKLPIVEFMPPTCSSSPSSYKSPSYANVLRIRARNLNKYRPTSSICSPSTQSTMMAVGGSASGTDDWFNNEEMLFARIVGLRLRKMDPCRRKEVFRLEFFYYL